MRVVAGLVFMMGALLAATPEGPRAEDVIASSAESVRPLGVGDTVPAVDVRNVAGETVALRTLIATRPTVLVFYRGGWCPYCNAQLSGLKKIDGELASLGYQLVAVSPDKPEKLAESTAKQELAYALVSDSTAEAIKSFGLAFRVDDETLARYRGFGIDLDESSGATHHLLPVPAVYVVGRSGKIQFVYWNADYKQRLDPEKVLKAAREALPKG